MPTLIHVCDAFTDTPFRGNPAAVCLLDSPREEPWMQRVARELNLSDTAFVHPSNTAFALRWFTPTHEVDLCGHATLASAHTLWLTGTLHPDAPARFHTRSGLLTCHRDDKNLIAMDFPSQPCSPCKPPDGLVNALNTPILHCATNQTDLLVELENESTVESLAPDLGFLKNLPFRGTIVTARSSRPNTDFVSRFFAPAFGIPEDPVTGSAHCALGPYWHERLKKRELTAYQASARGGTVHVEIAPPRVILRGQAVLVSQITLLH